MLSRLLAASRSFRFLRARPVRFCGCDNEVYFCPLMKVRGLPSRRAYSDFLILSSASPRCLMTWNLSNRIVACVALYVNLDKMAELRRETFTG